MKFLNFIRVSFCVLLVLVSSGCKDQDKKAISTSLQQVAPTPIDPVAVVNGEKISHQEFQTLVDRSLKRFSQGQGTSPLFVERIKKSIVRKLIDDSLIRQRAQKEGVSIDEVDESKAFGDYKNRLGGEQAFAVFLERNQVSVEDIKRSLRASLLREKLFEKIVKIEAVNDGDIRKFYDDNQGRYAQKEEIHASHIFWGINPSMSPQEKQEKLKKAKYVMALAKKPKADFAALAKRHGEGELAKQGGDLGTFARGRMLKAFEDAAFAARVGQIVGPVETENGYHVIKIFDKKRAKQRSLVEVRTDIARELLSRRKSNRAQKALDDLRKGAQIEIRDATLSVDDSPKG